MASFGPPRYYFYRPQIRPTLRGGFNDQQVCCMRLWAANRGLFRRACSGLVVPCLACQRRTGSTYGIAAFFPRESVVVAGDAKAYTRSSDSGYSVTFYFCPHCGSTVYWNTARKPDMVAVAVGVFADPAFPAPSQAVYYEHRHRWVPSGQAD